MFIVIVATKGKELVTFAPKDRKHWNYWRQGWRRRLLLDQWEIRIATDFHANDALWGRRWDKAVWGVSVFTVLLSPVRMREIHLLHFNWETENRLMGRKYKIHDISKYCPLLPFCTYYSAFDSFEKWNFFKRVSFVLKHLFWNKDMIKTMMMILITDSNNVNLL